MIRLRKQKAEGRRLSGWEFAVVMALLAVLVLLSIGLLPRLAQERRYWSCQANLKQIGQALSMYTNESRGEMFPLPKVKDCNGVIQPLNGAMDFALLYPDYLTDMDLFVCPSYDFGKTAVEVWDEGGTSNPRWERVEGFSGNGVVDPCEVLGSPYYYYGFAFSDLMFGPWDRREDADPEDYVPNEHMIKGWGRSVQVTEQYHPKIHNMRFRLATVSLAEKLASGRIDASARGWDMEYPSGKALRLPIGSSIPILREGAERFYQRDIGNPGESQVVRAKIVVLHEDVAHSRALLPNTVRQGNVLYMDGHVESLSLWKGAVFPYNEPGRILREAAAGTLGLPEGYTTPTSSGRGVMLEDAERFSAC